MSEELQNMEENEVNDNFTIDITQNENSTEVEAESAPEVTSEATVDDHQQKIDQAFKKEYAKRKQAERDAEVLQKQLEELKSKHTEVPAEIGEMPNEYDYATDEEYEDAKRKFIANVRARTEYDAKQKLIAEQQERTQEEAAQKRQAEIVAKAQAYSENAEKLGVDANELAQAGQAVASYGISEDLTMEILADSDGPLITKYLAGNPLEVENMSHMSPVQAGIYLATTIKAKANALKPKTSSASAPPTHLEGASTEPEDGMYPNLRGATFS